MKTRNSESVVTTRLNRRRSRGLRFACANLVHGTLFRPFFAGAAANASAQRGVNLTIFNTNI